MALPARRAPQHPRAPAAWTNPGRELDELQTVMERLMENVLTGAPTDGELWVPVADIEETEDAWIVEAEVPGVKRNDINVEVRDSEVAVTGEIKQRERKGILRRRTRRVGRFELRVTLPGQADAEGVDASLEDGVLTVRIPKSEHSRARRVEVADRGSKGASNGG
jgi:HSP20 family protein